MNVYQMYAHNGHQVGFWIVRDSWGNTLARVIEIEGATAGHKLPGRAPYHGNPRVLADFYSTSGKLLSQRSEVSCPGTYAYDLVQPSPELLAAMGFSVELPTAQPAAPAAVPPAASPAEAVPAATTFPYQDIRAHVEQGEWSVAQAFEVLKKLPKPWETAEWKAKRQDVLKDQCEGCGSQEPPLVLLNRQLPLSYPDVKTQVRNSILAELGRSVFDNITDEQAAAVMRSEKRQACPTCGIINIRSRKSMKPTFLCGRNHGFEQPVELDYYPIPKTTDRAKALQAAKNYLASVQLQAVLKANDEAVSRFALLESLAQSAEYVKMEAVTTLCRPCHYRARAEGIANKEWKLPLVPLISRFVFS
ncbi:hypothetical protein [Hymenobacter rigui]|uniref:Uncharacterized protein n=1 Tax=Hymenobacter rigui TaxID=334424 RepID=A0A3R9NEQ7_9BACT|nr:hypothetical protein [Hymenobacter rigui]RSK45482.1 hypothetical protein EI291_17960 [Hymenobacter rigui]